MSTSARRIAAAVVTSSVLFAACGSDGEPPLGSIERPGITAPPDGTTAPEPEQPPAEETPPAEEAPTEETPTEESPTAPPTAEDESLTTEEWIAIVLIGLLAVAAVVGIVAFLSRRRTDPGDASKQMRLEEVTRAARSIHDSTVMTLLQTADVVTLQSGWSVAQQQFVDLERRVAALAVDVADPTGQQVLRQLGTSLSGLQGALGSFVGLRLDSASAAQTELVQQSQQTVLARNQQLDAAINQALYLQL